MVLARLGDPGAQVAQLLEGAEEDLLTFYRLPAPIGPSFEAPARWSESTEKSDADPTWSGSSPTPTRYFASWARC